MGDPDSPSERWDDEDPSLRYPQATRRRALIARALAAVGILGSLALAAAAFAPHLSRLTTRSRPEPLAATPAPPAPAEVPPAVIVQQMPTVAPPPVEPPPIAPQPALVQPAPESEARSPQAAVEPPPAPPSAAAAVRNAPPPKASSSRRSRPEARLTPREIERREQRYELWLRREGLERIH